MAKSVTKGKRKTTAAKKPATGKTRAAATKKPIQGKAGASTGTKLKPGVRVALYCDAAGRVVQQEIITAIIRNARRITEQGIPDRPAAGEDEGGGCPPGKFPCRRADGTMGCCG
jgi:YD repeat-containing protein